MRGLTLIEVLIYLALFSMLMTGVIASMLSLKSGSERIEASARLTDEGHSLLEQLRYEIEQSKDAQTDGSRISLSSGKSFEVSDGILFEDGVPLNSVSSPISDWSVIANEEGGVEVSFLLTIYTVNANPISSEFSGRFMLLNAL